MGTQPLSTTTNIYDQLRQAHQAGGVDAVLDLLAEQLLDDQRYHELFEVRKMQVRRRLGLPLLYAEAGDELSDQQRDQLEEGLIAACREIGSKLVESGKLREGWMYLRPVGDRTLAAELMRGIEPAQENLEELIEISLHEGIDPQRGYRLLLENYGTCNAITTFDTLVMQRPKAERQQLAGLLLEHVHRELTMSLEADITRQEGKPPAEKSIAALVRDRDWLFGEFAYHLDTTHLASTVRAARLIDDPQQLRLALDLTEYGRRLSSQFQYRGEEPFVDIYPSHAAYFRALLGEDVEAAVELFADKARSIDPQQAGTAAIEVYVDLLARLGRHREAIAATIELTPPNQPALGIAPSLYELCEAADEYEALVQFCEQHGNLLGFASGLIRAGRSSSH